MLSAALITNQNWHRALFPRTFLVLAIVLGAIFSNASSAETPAQKIEEEPIEADRSPEALLQELARSPHIESIAFVETQVSDHEIGLGALRKVRGAWRYKFSERYSGWLQRYTWQIIDGFTSAEVMEEVQERLENELNAEAAFSCDGRACGHSTQWANRVFAQRVLYGKQDLQRYRVYKLAHDSDYRLLLYSSARTADRQYFHADLLRLTP